MLEESQPFLATEEVRRGKRTKSVIINIAAHLLIVCLYTIASLTFINHKIKSCWRPMTGTHRVTTIPPFPFPSIIYTNLLLNVKAD
ncbi:hypothetical protein H4I95_08913 [Botrytis cinerea]